MKRIINSSALIAGCLFLHNAFAQTPTAFAPYYPGVSLTGLTGSISTGFADILAPVFGNLSNIYYLDSQAMIRSGDDFAFAGGVGGRWLTETAGIFGAYVFGDCNNSEEDFMFCFVSPGIERLGDHFDFSANLYIPTGDQRVDTGHGFSSNLGDLQHVTFQGHSEFDTTISTYESVGLGGDAQLSYRLPFSSARNSRIYIGGYYFSPEDADNIFGGAVGAEIPINSYLSILASEAYDNQSNNILKVGLTLALWGRSTGYNFKGDLHERMVDPIRRNLIAVAGNARTFQPIAENQTEIMNSEELLTGITFFLPDTTASDSGSNADAQDGTFEHPYIGMNQNNINSANTENNRIFYVNTGVYSPTTSLTLTDDSLYGRDNYNGTPFLISAQGNNRPLFHFALSTSDDGFKAAGHTDLFDSVRMSGENSGYGIFIENNTAQTYSLFLNNTEESSFFHGIEAQNTSKGVLKISLSEFSATNNAVGFNAENHGIGEIDISSSDSVYSQNQYQGISLHNFGNGVLNFNDSTSVYNHNKDGLSATAEEGSMGTMNINLYQSNFNENVQGVTFISNGRTYNSAINASAYQATFHDNTSQGIFIENNTNGDINLFIDSSSFDNNGSQGLLAVNHDAGWTGLMIQNSHFQDNTEEGLYLINLGSGPLTVTASDSTMDKNGGAGFRIEGSNNGWINVDVEHSSMSGNGADGLNAALFGNIVMDITANYDYFKDNGGDGIHVQTNDDSMMSVFVTASNFINNRGYGVFGDNTNTFFYGSNLFIMLENSFFDQNQVDDTDAATTSSSINWDIR